MAIRTTEAAVRLVITTSMTSAQVTQIIADASLWIDENLDGECDDQSVAGLEYIERYLAAHLIQRAEGAGGDLTSASRSDISETYSSTDKDAHNKFAAIASKMDPCGIVAEFWLDIRKVRAVIGRGYADV